MLRSKRRTALGLGLGIFLLALWPRLSLRQELVTADEDSWLGMAGGFSVALTRGQPRQTYQIGHPGITAFWTSLAGLGPDRAARYAGLVVYDGQVAVRRAAAREPTFLQDLAAARRAHAIVNSALAACLALLVWQLVGLPAAALAGGLLALDPFLVAHSQVIRMDSLQAGLLGICWAAALLRWLSDRGRRYLVIAGVAFGLGLLSKISSLLLVLPLAACALIVAVSELRRGDALRRVGQRLALDLLTIGASAGAIIWLAFPALWVAPWETIQQIVEFSRQNSGSPAEAGNFFLGQPVSEPGPAYYIVAALFRLTPLALLGLLAAILALWQRGPSAHQRGALIWLLVAAAMLGLILSIAPKKADRYLLPIWPMLLIGAGLGLEYLIRRAGQRRPIAAAAAALLIAAQTLWLPPRAYSALSYFNPLFGGLSGASRAILVGWGERLEQAGAYLSELPEAEQLSATTLYSDALRPNLRGRSLPLSRYPEAEYLVDYVNMQQRQVLPPALEAFVGSARPVFSVEVGGVRYVAVYELPALRFAEELRLNQFALDGDSAARGERLQALLQWTPLTERATGWRPRLELVDADGRVVSGAVAATAAAPVGARARGQVRLQVPDRRGNLQVALSVVDESGAPVPPSAAPPWATASADRFLFASSVVRVR